ncbi:MULTISPECIES: hypothetical protein [unclassified Rathayibacter]|uniref:hypothetical protein n=1 Tax=unclassified Rathayibacter TaxID=2609250 RepID=UPI0011B07DC2|nr:MULTISPECIES: hypothetical protein [unclassified Rathayibacter]
MTPMDGSGPVSGESDAVVGAGRPPADAGRREHPSRCRRGDGEPAGALAGPLTRVPAGAREDRADDGVRGKVTVDPRLRLRLVTRFDTPTETCWYEDVEPWVEHSPIR